MSQSVVNINEFTALVKDLLQSDYSLVVLTGAEHSVGRVSSYSAISHSLVPAERFGEF